MADVTIYGAGIFGLSIAWVCAQRGATVAVVDPAGPGAGASGGTVGALAPHVPENWNAKKAFQLDSLLMAGAFWADVDAAGGGSAGYARIGRLQPIADDKALTLARDRAAQAQVFWRGEAAWRVVAAEDAGHWRPHSPSGWLIHDTLSARLRPRQAIAALVAALATRGVTIGPDARDAGPVIWATGAAGLAQLSRDTGKPVGTAVKGQSALLGFDAGANAPQLFIDGVHLVPHGDCTLAIGSTSERDFANPGATDHALDALIDKARKILPALADAPVIDRWAGLRPRARSRAPILGPYPGRSGHFVANGGFKIGFGMAPKLAEVMADLVLEDQNHIPPDFHIDTCL